MSTVNSLIPGQAGVDKTSFLGFSCDEPASWPQTVGTDSLLVLGLQKNPMNINEYDCDFNCNKLNIQH